MKKFYEIGAKTGLSTHELHKAARFGLFGLITLALAALAACFKGGKTASHPVEPASRTSDRQQPQTLQDLVGEIDKSTGAAETKTDAKCGPYPGYPCGTRYYTVSVGDFKKIN